jgi:hypothetical protein
VETKLVYLGLLAICSAYALFEGGAPERIAAAIWIADSMLTPLMRSWNVERYQGPEPGVLLLDMIALAGFLALAIYANRFWPLWICAVHGIGCFGHLAKALHPSIDPRAYYLMVGMGGFPICLLLLIGAIRHRQRARRLGADPSWSVS